jgi:hypothetical protein
MKFIHFAVAAVAAGALLGFIWPANADPMPMDQEITVNGIQTACSGIGDEPKQDPRWPTYPIRVEFSNGGQQYLAGAHVTLSKGGKPLAVLDCSGAWVLFKLPAGTYKVSATATDQAGAGERSATFSPPASGQKRVILDFHVAPNQ